MSYVRFADVYDELMRDVPYEKWLELLIVKLKQYNISGKRVLDLACGTGEITVELARHGFEVTGVDLSENMLAVAHEKAMREGFSIPFFQQNMAELENLGVYDCITIFCDSLNYLRQEEEVGKTFQSAYRHLEQGGLFLFDVHSIFKIEKIFQNHTFAVNDEAVSYIWECFPGKEEYSVEHDLSFFVNDQDSGMYERFDEFHYQRTYPLSRYKIWLEESGFEVLETLSDLEENAVHAETERILFIARKKNEGDF
jgi:SAM-dependent methyltransferase